MAKRQGFQGFRTRKLKKKLSSQLSSKKVFKCLELRSLSLDFRIPESPQMSLRTRAGSKHPCLPVEETKAQGVMSQAGAAGRDPSDSSNS